MSAAGSVPPDARVVCAQAPGADAAAERLPLFRAQAIVAQADLRMGLPVALMPVSWKVLTYVMLILVCATSLFLAVAVYSRKETVSGILRASGGDLRVTAQAPGVVREVFVSQGAVVARGTRLAIISTAQELESGATADGAMLAALKQEEDGLRIRLEALQASASYEEAAADAEIAALAAERQAASEMQVLIAERLRIAEERLQLGRQLGNFIAVDEVRRREDAAIAQREAAAEAGAHEASLAARITELRARRAQQPHLVAQQRAQIEAQLAALLRRRAQLEAAGSYALDAPIAGRITALQVASGQAVDPNRPLMTITPTEAPLLAELYVPSRAIAFVRVGQRVRLLYDAFPYQHFGSGAGIVEAVSATVLSPSELQTPVHVSEAVYRVVVRLERTTIDADGQSWPLMAGMALSADIILEQRTFLQWLLAPLLAVRGRM
jgi:membrane fusion protein